MVSCLDETGGKHFRRGPLEQRGRALLLLDFVNKKQMPVPA